MLWRKKYKITDIRVNLSRENLLRRGRILFIDDERPSLIDDLKAARFSVDYESDLTKDNMKVIETPIYDLILLDFGNVGRAFGQDEGLSILKHIKRVNPSVVVTSKLLGVEHSDFYRLANDVLAKDKGIADSMQIIEDGLRLAMSPENLWSGFLQVSYITPGSKQDLDLQDSLVRALNNPSHINKTKQEIFNLLGEGTKIVGSVILEKLIEMGITGLAS